MTMCLAAMRAMGLGLGLLLRAEPWLAPVLAPGTEAGFAELAGAAAEAVPFNAGTGFFVNPEGDFVSPHHVIGGCERPAIETPSGLWPARPVAASSRLDIVVLRSAMRPAAHAIFADYRTRLAPGVLWLARFRSCGGLGSRSIVEAEPMALPRTWAGFIAFEAAELIEGGNSGSPVVDAQGVLAGMLVARASVHAHTGFAIDGPTLKGFLLGAGVRFETAPESLPLPDGIAGAVAAQFAFPVVCLY